MYCRKWKARMQMQKKGISGFNESATWYLPTPLFLAVVPNYPNAYNHYQKFNPGLFYLSLPPPFKWNPWFKSFLTHEKGFLLSVGFLRKNPIFPFFSWLERFACACFDCELGVVVDQTFPSFLWMDGSRRDGENFTLINKALDICIFFFSFSLCLWL